MIHELRNSRDYWAGNRKPLISILILSYNNYQYIYTALDSIFAQDYENIELIISDDASLSFPLQEISDYVNIHAGTNICSCIINVNEHNQKTVAHVEKIRDLSHGQYVTIIAADDAYYDCHSISTLYGVFAENQSCQVAMGQTIMCDSTLNKELYPFTKPEEISIVNSGDFDKLFYTLSCRIFLPAAGVLFKRQVFDIIGPLSPFYVLVEDWTTHLRLAREKVTIKFVDIPLIRHRDGGVSHGNTNGEKGLNLLVWDDIIRGMEHEIFPYMYRFTSDQYHYIRWIYAGRVNAYEREKKASNSSSISKTQENTTESLGPFQRWDEKLHRLVAKLSTVTLPNRLCKCLLLLSPLACWKKLNTYKRLNPLTSLARKSWRAYIKKKEYLQFQAGYNKKLKYLNEHPSTREVIKTAFIVIFDSTFPAISVFEKMLSDMAFDPFIIVTPDISRGKKHSDEAYHHSYNNLYEKYGDRVIRGYNCETGNYLELKDEYPLIFFSNPYRNMVHPYHYIDYFKDKNVLTAYIDYGFPAVKYARVVFQTDFYSKVWKVFSDSNITKKELFFHQPIRGKNAIVTGYSKMDKLEKAPLESRARKRIIICPHHTVLGWKPLDISNFETYAELFVRLPKDFPDIDFVFRPHPLLFTNLLNSKKWSQEKLDDYMERMLSYPNIVYDESGDYFTLFKNSDAMIHDCSSFIGEYLFTENPCCYLLKNESQIKEVYTQLGQLCLKHYYKAFTENDIYQFIQQVVINGDDPIKNKRQAFSRKVLKRYYPHSAETITVYLKKTLKMGINL